MDYRPGLQPEDRLAFRKTYEIQIVKTDVNKTLYVILGPQQIYIHTMLLCE